MTPALLSVTNTTLTSSCGARQTVSFLWRCAAPFTAIILIEEGRALRMSLMTVFDVDLGALAEVMKLED